MYSSNFLGDVFHMLSTVTSNANRCRHDLARSVERLSVFGHHWLCRRLMATTGGGLGPFRGGRSPGDFVDLPGCRET